MKTTNIKPSGIDWIDDIPAEWEVTRIKYSYSFFTGWTPPTKDDVSYLDENMWANISDIGDCKILENTENRISDTAVKESNICISEKGSLLFSFKLSIGLVSFAGNNMYTNEAIATFPLENPCLSFFYYSAPLFIVKNSNENIYGAKMLNQDLIKNAFILFPPISEQKEMANYLDTECAKIDTIINEKQQSIETMQSYKKSLIYEYTTGKKRTIDVRSHHASGREVKK
ncbi:MAG: hypothetical protein Ta2F_17820 [Termitinemataceae bacterium]|nr:MAG: hypothetical protein Ta2F_17820 [Termitinemataceae bacterium]